MSQADVYSQTGEKVGTHRLAAEVFGVEPKVELIQQVVVAIQSNLRRGTAHAKQRGEVRGGGKKPWQQKGTGRARAGSIRSPLWRGGGIIFGPRKERNYGKKINKKVQRQALLMSLSDKATNHKLIVVDDLTLPNFKTKEFVQLLQKLPIKFEKCLFVYCPDEAKITRAARNIASITTIPFKNLDLLSILKNNYLLISKTTLKHIEAQLNPKLS